MKARFRIRWTIEVMFTGSVIVVNHWLQPMNNEAKIMVHNIYWEVNL